MSSDYKHKVQTVFDQALTVSSSKRDEFIAQACADDDELKDDVLSLLGDVDAMNRAQTRAGGSVGSTTTSYQSGDVIGHYRIIDQIGMGGMGVIYQAIDSRLQRDVALKFLPASLQDDESYRQRFMAEARSASKLDHPNICVIHDINETADGRMYISMPYYQGETLAGRLKRGRVPIPEALSIAIQVAKGLAAAHTVSIVHRDVKPANIMLPLEGPVKVLDFGIAKVENVRLTNTGMSVGTLAYMAPEQIHGQEVDAGADIWALGVTLCEMLTGQTAFEGDGTSQIVNAVLDENSTPDYTLDQHIPEALHMILARSMQRDRTKRYPEMAAFINDCTQLDTALNEEDNSTRIAPRLNRTTKNAYAWDDRFIATIIELLLPMLGPITAKIVHRQAKHANSVETLCSSLCKLLPDEKSRKSFTEKMKLKASMNTTPPSPNSIRVTNPSAQLVLSPVQQAKIETLLIPHIGPIAGSLVRRAMATTSDWNEACHVLTDSLTNSSDKTKITTTIMAIINE